MTKNQIEQRKSEAGKEEDRTREILSRRVRKELMDRFRAKALDKYPDIRSFTHALEEAMEDWISKS